MATESTGSTPDQARRILLDAGADQLQRRPWQHRSEPPDDATLVRFALWRASGRAGSGSDPELAAALALIGAARSDLDAVESALLFTARAEGMTWAKIAEQLRMRSPQAAQQRLMRASPRPDDPDVKKP